MLEDREGLSDPGARVPSGADVELVLRRAGAFLTALAVVAECVRVAGVVEDSGEDISRITTNATKHLASSGALGEADQHTISTALSYARGLGYELVRVPLGLDNRIDIELLELLVALQGVIRRLDLQGSPTRSVSLLSAGRLLLDTLVEQSQPPAEQENNQSAPEQDESQ